MGNNSRNHFLFFGTEMDLINELRKTSNNVVYLNDDFFVKYDGVALDIKAMNQFFNSLMPHRTDEEGYVILKMDKVSDDNILSYFPYIIKRMRKHDGIIKYFLYLSEHSKIKPSAEIRELCVVQEKQKTYTHTIENIIDLAERGKSFTFENKKGKLFHYSKDKQIFRFLDDNNFHKENNKWLPQELTVNMLKDKYHINHEIKTLLKENRVEDLKGLKVVDQIINNKLIFIMFNEDKWYLNTFNLTYSLVDILKESGFYENYNLELGIS